MVRWVLQLIKQMGSANDQQGADLYIMKDVKIRGKRFIHRAAGFQSRLA